MIFFRLRYTLTDLTMPLGEEPVHFDLDGPLAVKVSMRGPSPEEANQYAGQNVAFATAAGTGNPNPANLAILQSLAADQLPDGVVVPAGWPLGQPIGADGKLNGIVLSREFFPQGFQSYADQVEGTLSGLVIETVKAARWRLGALGPPRPFSAGPFQFSIDGEHWRRMPGSFTTVVGEVGWLQFDDQVAAEIKELVTNKTTEPLAHELLREAISLHLMNPRSALMVGMSALEVGMKDCIADLIPDADWLVHNVPAPPVQTMLSEYLAKLPVRKKIEDKVLRPGQPDLDLIRKWINIRNRLVHSGAGELKHAELYQTLRLVRDILYLLDYYRGHTWALERMSEDVRNRLQ